jgi:hypothetical protein
MKDELKKDSYHPPGANLAGAGRKRRDRRYHAVVRPIQPAAFFNV